MLWSVRNEIGAAGLPVEAWAQRASARLLAVPGVRAADVRATLEDDDPDDEPLAGLSVDVRIEHRDRDAAATIVEQTVMSALFDVVGDQEVGWTAYDWDARPLPAGAP